MARLQVRGVLVTRRVELADRAAACRVRGKRRGNRAPRNARQSRASAPLFRLSSSSIISTGRCAAISAAAPSSTASSWPSTSILMKEQFAIAKSSSRFVSISVDRRIARMQRIARLDGGKLVDRIALRIARDFQRRASRARRQRHVDDLDIAAARPCGRIAQPPGWPRTRSPCPRSAPSRPRRCRSTCRYRSRSCRVRSDGRIR